VWGSGPCLGCVSCVAGRCMCGEVDHVLAVCRVLLVGVCVGKWTVSWLCRVLLVGVCVGKWTVSWLCRVLLVGVCVGKWTMSWLWS